ncbi:hypothetical protein BpHYR1_047894 [Brachionus plicatilis]|uniref:Uncharacterized protein n=1 Tax=Brachionus plicatilis TaxID=10195 RepID=A0A3M7PH36_BRAPC|nr:hypothetical protein BpHYR1_047894 [Brachionus plicatilis]
MLQPRTTIQKSKTLNPDDEKIFSTYQAEYNLGKSHGNLLAHNGNIGFLKNNEPILGKKNVKSFVSPSYQNLTSESFMANKLTDNYSNNYRTSQDNVLHRPIHTAPARTKLDFMYNVTVPPVAKPDHASIYQEEHLNQNMSDHFVSKRWLKTGTVHFRDVVACLMELGDYMRNKSHDINSRNVFETYSGDVNNLDKTGQLFTELISAIESIMLSYNKLHCNATELKKNSDNFIYGQRIIDRNIWDRGLRPTSERDVYKSTEESIHKDNLVMKKCRELANQVLKEAQNVLNSLESYAYNNLEEIFEEAKVILMHKLHTKAYETAYLRDSNGYIKNTAKLPMKIEDWFKLAMRGLVDVNNLVHKSDLMNKKVIDTIDKIGFNMSKQWLDTHEVAANQVEKGLAYQSKLIDRQYDLNREIDQLSDAIGDTRKKLGTLDMINEVYLTQLETKLNEIEPYHMDHKYRQAKYNNAVWGSATELRDNLSKMNDYKIVLNDRKQRLNTNILSNHYGINYDLKTIINPRRCNISTNPSVDLVAQSFN